MEQRNECHQEQLQICAHTSVALQRLVDILQTRQVRLMSAEHVLQFGKPQKKKPAGKRQSETDKACEPSKVNKKSDHLGYTMVRKKWAGYVMRHTVSDEDE